MINSPIGAYSGATREVSTGLRLRLIFGGIKQILWLLLGVAFVAAWGILPNSELVDRGRFNGPLATADGTVTGWTKSDESEGGSRHQKGTPVYATQYTFTPQGASTPVRGESFATGTYRLPGETVTVEYPVANPSISRVRGMRSRPLEASTGVLGLVLPVVVVLSLLFMWFRSRKAIRLLESGVCTRARLTGIVLVNHRTRSHRLTFEFTPEGGASQRVSMTASGLRSEWRAFRDVGKTKIPAGAMPIDPPVVEELVLYLRENPNLAMMLPDMARSLSINELGKIEGDRSYQGFLSLIIPLAVVVGHGVYLVYRSMQ